jgi:glutamyl-tRNA reductase
MLLALGISHKTAPISVREGFAFTTDEVRTALGDLQKQTNAQEALLLSTCNRTEIYCYGAAKSEILNWWQSHRALNVNILTPHIYHHTNHMAVAHLMRVAAGLDSLVLGEPQILGQLKDAYRTAKQQGVLGKQLSRLCQSAFQVAKIVRTSTGISTLPVSVAYAAVNLAKHIFSNLQDTTALLVGAGDTILLTAQHLKQAGVGKLIIANRTYERGQAVANQVNASNILLSDLPEFLSKADIVVSATSAPVPIIGKGAMESALKQRKNRPVFMVDLAVPRDIEPEVAQLQDVYLYTVDDLQGMITENAKARLQAAKEAEKIVIEKSKDYMLWLHSQDAFRIIQQFRDQMNTMCAEELSTSMKLLESGKSAESVMQRFAHHVTQKLLHVPTMRLRRAAHKQENQVLDLFKTLLEVNSDD